VITGVSGSGKSSLAFDTIYAEGQRRYIESMSIYAKQFLEQLSRPEVDAIDGLSPTISIQQKTIGFNPRSTVGTVTELWDFLRLLYARIAEPQCYSCGQAIQSMTTEQIVNSVLALNPGDKIVILAPLVRERKGEYQAELAQLRASGFVRARIDGVVRDLHEPIELTRNKKHTIEVVIDRLILRPEAASDQKGGFRVRLEESIETALKLGKGQLLLQHGRTEETSNERLVSQSLSCANCNIAYPPAEPRTFSFNSPIGQCEECEGLGIKADPDSLFTTLAQRIFSFIDKANSGYIPVKEATVLYERFKDRLNMHTKAATATITNSCDGEKTMPNFRNEKEGLVSFEEFKRCFLDYYNSENY
jgi:excinuclease ABC subunit A